MRGLELWSGAWRGVARQGLQRTVEVPRSVPGLVTERLLVMSFLGGEQVRRSCHRSRF